MTHKSFGNNIQLGDIISRKVKYNGGKEIYTAIGHLVYIEPVVQPANEKLFSLVFLFVIKIKNK